MRRHALCLAALFGLVQLLSPARAQDAVSVASFQALCKASQGADAQRLAKLKATWRATSAQIGADVADKEKTTNAAFGGMTAQVDRTLPYLRQQQEMNAYQLEHGGGDQWNRQRRKDHYDLYTDNIELLESVKNTIGSAPDVLDGYEEELERRANPNIGGLQWLTWIAHRDILASFRAWRAQHAELQEAYARQEELKAAAVEALKCIDGKADAHDEAKTKAVAHLQAKAAKLKAEFLKIIDRLKEGVRTLEISRGEARMLDQKGRKIGKELDATLRQIEQYGGEVDKEADQLATFYRSRWR